MKQIYIAGREYRTFSAVEFDDTKTSINTIDYSKLKFGDDHVAKKFGYDLAVKYFRHAMGTLTSKRTVVIPAPYNVVQNAASVMTKHFINKLNELLISANGVVVDTTLFHRKVTYTQDYGKLPAEQRAKFLNNDSFYPNINFIENAHLIFIDDVMITGTHEKKLIETLKEFKLTNSADFLYYCSYKGHRAEIESELNTAFVSNIRNYLDVANDPQHNTIVRPIKYVLSLPEQEFTYFLANARKQHLVEVVNGALAEGYFKIPAYQKNLTALQKAIV